jgi:hypothetical protein
LFCRYGEKIRASSHYASMNTGLIKKGGEEGEGEDKGKIGASETAEKKHHAEAKGHMTV